MTSDNAGEVVGNVSALLTGFSSDDQSSENFVLVTTIYEGIDDLIKKQEFNVSVNVSI